MQPATPRAEPMIGRLGEFLVNLDSRVISGLALAVSLLAVLLTIRNRRVDREREAARSGADSEKAAKDRATFLAAFIELRFPLDPDGVRRFVYEWPASWESEPLSQPVAPMLWKDAFFLVWAVRQLRPTWIHSSVRPQDTYHWEAQGGRFLHETDAARSKRLRFHYVDHSGRRAYLGMMRPAKDEVMPFDVCVKHRRFFDTGTPNCGECGLPLARVREQNERLLEELGVRFDDEPPTP